MLRDYETGIKDDVLVFTGPEVEHTPAFGKQTLFLARNDLSYDEIKNLCVEEKCEAIYFGANRSFMHNIANTPLMINKLLDDGYFVTIDYQYAVHEDVKANFKNVWNKENFIPFCSIIFEDSENDDNLCFKIDDVDFNKSNPGVWTTPMSQYKQFSGFTSWNEYKKDKPILRYAKKEKEVEQF